MFYNILEFRSILFIHWIIHYLKNDQILKLLIKLLHFKLPKHILANYKVYLLLKDNSANSIINHLRFKKQ